MSVFQILIPKKIFSHGFFSYKWIETCKFSNISWNPPPKKKNKSEEI